jgi:hypothetical protein
MNRLALACALGVLYALSAFAVPAFTPVVDGVKDAGWGSTPDWSTTSQADPTGFNLDGGMYVTDDNVNLYFGFDADNDPLVDGKSVHVHILMDVNNTAAGGGFGCWNAVNAHYAMPYLPEYDIVMQWNTTNESAHDGYTGLQTWLGWWSEQQLTNDAGGGNSWTELAVPKSLLSGVMNAGVPLNFSMWLRPTWDCAGGCACLPADASFPSTNGSLSATLHSQWAYTTQVTFGEAIPPQILSWKQIDRDEVELVFNEPMNQTTLSNVANYTPNGWSVASPVSYVTATTLGLRSNFNFVEGNPYSVICNPAVTDVAGNAIDPANDSAGWNAVDYADLIVVVAAPSAYTCLRFKGSFNFYHEYDSGWSGGGKAMYDNGTNGDSVAGDGRWTIVWPLVPSATPYEWGAETCASQWLIQGANQQVTITDGGQYYAFYQVPDPTTVDCQVTFHCDMQFASWFHTQPYVAGSFNGWPAPGTPMTDPDLDSVYTLTLTIPAGSARHQEFKFQYIDELSATQWEYNNRAFDITGAPTTLDLGQMFWNDWIPALSSVTAIKSGTDVRIRWYPYQRVSFQVFAHSVPDSIMENGAIIGTTTNPYYDVTPTPTRQFYQVRAVYP